MPISKETMTKLATFSQENKQDEIVALVKQQLAAKEFTAAEMLDYSTKRIFSEKPGKPYVIIAATINKIGVAVEALEDKDQAKLATEFYKLAAGRGSSWGNRNYAQILLNQSRHKEEALLFAEKAIQIAINDKLKPEEHKLVLCKTLRANQEYEKANIALIQFLKHQSTFTDEKSKKKIKEALDLVKMIMQEFHVDLKTPKTITKKRWQDNIKELVPFVTAYAWCPPKEYPAIEQEAHYIKGLCHEHLGEHPMAMECYCRVDDKGLPFYKEAVESRARLIKFQIAKELSVKPITNSGSVAMDEKEDKAKETKETKSLVVEQQNQQNDNEDQKKALEVKSDGIETDKPRRGIKRKLEETITKLPDETPFPVQFHKNWCSEAAWLDSVDEITNSAEYEKRLAQLDKLISAKKLILELHEEDLENKSEIKENDENSQMKKVEAELEQLKQVKIKLGTQYKRHSYSFRARHRRHQAETKFFDPKRCVKPERLIGLTNEIIAHRYNTTSQLVAPVNLDNTSARTVITAENAFLKSIVALTGDRNPNLGIPTAREKDWEIGDYSGKTGFGPVERYQVSGTEVKAEHRTKPKRERLGDSFLPDHGTYDRSIYPLLFKLGEGIKANEIQLTKFMLRYGKTHQGPTLEELQVLCPEAEKNDVEEFTRVCFLVMEKEQAQWHCATKETHQLGMAVAQAWSLIMLEAGYITMEEVFKNNTLFGVYSQTKLVDQPKQVADSCDRINRLYLQYLKTKNTDDYFTFLKRHIKKDKGSECAITQEQMRQDLRYVYGGDSDSDNEGYDTDLEMSPRQNRV